MGTEIDRHMIFFCNWLHKLQFFFRIKFNVETKNIFILCIICHIKTLVHVYFCYFSNQVVPTRVSPDVCWTRNKLSAMMLNSQFAFLTTLFWKVILTKTNSRLKKKISTCLLIYRYTYSLLTNCSILFIYIWLASRQKSP